MPQFRAAVEFVLIVDYDAPTSLEANKLARKLRPAALMIGEKLLDSKTAEGKEQRRQSQGVSIVSHSASVQFVAELTVPKPPV